jgi:hypothetical protein
MFYQLLELAKQTLGIIPVVTPVPGAAVVAGVAAEIMRTCEDVSYQKVFHSWRSSCFVLVLNPLGPSSGSGQGNWDQEHPTRECS